MENKITTSIQYQLSNGKLFQEIFGNWRKFNEELKKGPENMRQWLFDKWYEVKEELKDRPDLILRDLDRKVTKEEFGISFAQTKKGTNVFFFIFPDYEYTDAASKYVALALTPRKPRYITLEYTKRYGTTEKQFVMGEFVFNEEINKKMHKNYGNVDNDRIGYFARSVLDMIERENDENKN